MTCNTHAHQGSWMRPNARALVNHVHCAHRAGGTVIGTFIAVQNPCGQGAKIHCTIEDSNPSCSTHSPTLDSGSRAPPKSRGLGGRVGSSHRAPTRPTGGTNTFNNKERVYSRAIAFSNRRCSVPLESTLPNISAMYIKLIYMYIA